MLFDAQVELLAAKYRGKGVLVDSNLLLLLVIGAYRRDRIATFKRTAKFTVRDLLLLRHLFFKFDIHLTTPNILTEVDNLGRQLQTNEYPEFAKAFRSIAGKMSERHLGFEESSSRNEFPRLGLSDTTSLILSANCLLLSDDLPLYIQVTRAGRDAINFNHLRL